MPENAKWSNLIVWNCYSVGVPDLGIGLVNSCYVMNDFKDNIDRIYKKYVLIVKYVYVQFQVRNHFALMKFMKWAGPDWRTSKYLYAISSTQASIHQVRYNNARKILFTLIQYFHKNLW